jgi:hypothetical protein
MIYINIQESETFIPMSTLQPSNQPPVLSQPPQNPGQQHPSRTASILLWLGVALFVGIIFLGIYAILNNYTTLYTIISFVIAAVFIPLGVLQIMPQAVQYLLQSRRIGINIIFVGLLSVSLIGNLISIILPFHFPTAIQTSPTASNKDTPLSEVDRTLRNYCQDVINNPTQAHGYLSPFDESQSIPPEGAYKEPIDKEGSGHGGLKACHSVVDIDTKSHPDLYGYALGAVIYTFSDGVDVLHEYKLFQRTARDPWKIDIPYYQNKLTY